MMRKSKIWWSTYSVVCASALAIDASSPTVSNRESHDDDIRLVGGTSPLEGRVEIYHDGVWGTVCDDSFSDVEAGVVCLQLRYSSLGAKVYPSAHYGKGRGTIWLDDVVCFSGDYRLSSCSNDGWGHHDCSHSEDVGVKCRKTSDVSSYSATSSVTITATDTDTATATATATDVNTLAIILPVVGIANIFVLFIVISLLRRARRSRSTIRYRRLLQSETIEMIEYEAPSVVMATREPEYSITFSSSFPSQSVNYVLGSKEEAKRPLQPTSSESLPPFGPLNPQKAEE